MLEATALSSMNKVKSGGWIPAQRQTLNTSQVFFYHINILKLAQHRCILENWSLEAFWHGLRKKTQQEMSVCGGVRFISWFKHCHLRSSNTSSFMSAPWCCSVRNYFSEYAAFWKDTSPPRLSCSLILLLSLSVSVCVLQTHTKTHTHCNMHTTRHEQPLLKLPPPPTPQQFCQKLTMSWFSCLAVPASFPCCANVNRTSCWAPKNTTSRQPHSWQLLFMALPKWMGISVQTFHHAPAATHKSHWFPANLHLFYSRRLKLGKGRERDRQRGREKTFIMT